MRMKRAGIYIPKVRTLGSLRQHISVKTQSNNHVMRIQVSIALEHAQILSAMDLLEQVQFEFE
jgi:biopolymer transport protein ExbD